MALTKLAQKFSVGSKRPMARSKVAHSYIQSGPWTNMAHKSSQGWNKGQTLCGPFLTKLCAVLDIHLGRLIGPELWAVLVIFHSKQCGLLSGDNHGQVVHTHLNAVLFVTGQKNGDALQLGR